MLRSLVSLSKSVVWRSLARRDARSFQSSVTSVPKGTTSLFWQRCFADPSQDATTTASMTHPEEERPKRLTLVPTGIPDLAMAEHVLTNVEQLELLHVMEYLRDAQVQQPADDAVFQHDFRVLAGELPLPIRNVLTEPLRRLMQAGLIAAPPPADRQLAVFQWYRPYDGLNPSHDAQCTAQFRGEVLAFSLGTPCVVQFIETATKHVTPLLLQGGAVLVRRGRSKREYRAGIEVGEIHEYNGQKFRRNDRAMLVLGEAA